MVQDIKETRRIVRILTTDIDGSLNVERALRKIRGVSFMFSKATCIATGIDPRRKVGQLNETEVKTLEGFIKKPQLPAWMQNRRKDPETGENMHITMADLQLKKRDDINLLRKLRAYKGIRHELGQPVRGQRTRSSFRTQKSVGVSKKKIQEAAKPKPKEEKKK
ncbi:MAG: 30S ribosomal protein S13 [Candidatus Aenigmatarchaeota archaeon]